MGFYDDQKDIYRQTHYQLLGEHRFNRHWKLNVALHFTDGYGYSPTYREIGAAVGLRSPASVATYIKALRDEGKLDMTAKRPRAVALNRRIPMKLEEPQRLRVEMADGGVFFLDCAIKRSAPDDFAVVLSGVMDGSNMKASVGSIVGCTIEAE